MHVSNESQHYKPSGKIDFGRCLPLFVVALIIASVLAVLLYVLYSVGFYFVMLVPFFAALLMGLVVRWVVQGGRVRNRGLAAVVGVLLGGVMYLGAYYVGMAHALGPAEAHHVELLPDYISWRMHTDVAEDPAMSNLRKDDPRPPDRAQVVFNWVFFYVELAACLVIGGLAGFVRASRPYCERCGEWLDQQLVIFPPDRGPAVAEALEESRLSELADWPQVPSRPNQPNTTLAIERCTKGQTDAIEPCPAYLSVKACKSGSLLQSGRFEMALGKAILKRRRLEPADSSLLASLFAPGGSSASVSSIGATTAHVAGAAASPDGAIPAAEVAIEHVQMAEPRKGAVVNRRTLAKSAVWSLAPLGIAIVPLGILVAGIALAAIEADKPGSVGTSSAVYWSLVAIGGLGTVIAIIWVARHLTSWRDRFLLRRVREVVQAREDRWVDADDPEAVFVEFVPRENWIKVMVDTAADFGFIKADHERGELTFEGDCNRYALPYETIVACEVEPILNIQGQHHFTAVVIRARDAEKKLELPFVALVPPFLFGKKASLRNATALCLKIEEMRRASAPSEPAAL